MMLTRSFFILVVICLLVVPVKAQNGGTQSPFSMGAGARELSQGGAASAHGSFVTAPFWNPSRLSNAEQLSLGAFHSRLYESDVSYQYLGLVVPTMDFGTFGAGVFRLSVSDIELRDDNNALLGNTDDNRLAVYLAYGRYLSGYSIGVATTIEHHSLADYTATSSPGINLSVSRKFTSGAAWLDEVSVVANGRNLVSPNLVLDQYEVSYPSMYDAGLSADLIPFAGWNHRLVLSARIWKTELVDPKAAFGLEYNIADMLYLRSGLNDNRIGFGLGLNWDAFKFDYAVVDRDLGSLHMFSLTTSVGTPVSIRRDQRVKQREDELKRMMSDRFTQRNQSLVGELVSQGKSAFSNGDLKTASEVLDRALFLAQGIDIDTLVMASLKRQVDNQLFAWERENRHAALLDSVTAKLVESNYLAAQYFAAAAAQEFPDSDSAGVLLRHIKTTLAKLAAEQDFVNSSLAEIDSLLSFGDLEQATTMARTLQTTNPDHVGIQRSIRRLQFERWRSAAASAYTESDWTGVGHALDSMDTIFPDNKWSQDFRSRLDRERQGQAQLVVTDTATQPPRVLSGLMLEKVESLYKQAQESFQAGAVSQAIDVWEEIENLTPDFRSVRDHLVDAYKFVGIELYGANNLSEAVGVWEKAIQLRPDRAEILNYLNRAKSEMTKLQQLSYE